MPNINEEWVKQQFAEAKVRVGVGKATLALLHTWNDVAGLKEADYKTVVDLFSKLALNHSLVEPSKNEVWAPAQPGFINVGDEVRVANDAFSDSTGVIHNGRRGNVVGVRYGDVIIRSNDGKEPFLDGAHYSPYKLEKRVK